MVNINTETLPTDESRPRRRSRAARRPILRMGDDGQGDSRIRARVREPDQNFQDFFNRFFGQVPEAAPGSGRPGAGVSGLRLYRRSARLHRHQQSRRRKGGPNLREAVDGR